MIPVHDRNPTRRPAYVTRALVLANVVVFLVSPLGLGGLGESGPEALCSIQSFFDRWGAIPRELISNEQLPLVTGGFTRDPSGAPACLLVSPGYDKSPLLSAITAMFLHGGWLHLLGNMLFLAIFGNNVEDRLGHVRFLLFYLACGLAATYAFAVANPGSRIALVGASGAIAGVLGAYLAWFPRVQVTALVPFLFFIPLPLPAWLVLGMWFVIQWLYAQGAGISEATGVAYLAHVVGFLVGFLIALVMGRPRDPVPYGARRQPGH